MLATFRFPQDLAQLEQRLGSGLDRNEKAAEAARAVIDAVRARGDAAVAELTERFDGVSMTPDRFRVEPAEMEAAWLAQAPEFREAIEFALARIDRYHRAQLPVDLALAEGDGTLLRRVWRPLQRVGVYVPGGSAAYPSTVLMNVVPALVAGVPEVVLTTPPARSGGPAAATILAVAHRLGMDEVYRLGGAQAVAALALGTQTIRRVDKIVGPGNAYVNEAKRLLYGAIDIDSLAGPSEVLVIADDSANPAYVAADLLAQAEHSPDAQAVLVVLGGEAVLGPIQAEVKRQTDIAPRAEIIRQSLARYGTAIHVQNADEAIAAANWKAPEHLEIQTRDADRMAEHARGAGAIFVGAHTPEAVCDYVAGPNHVLPTGGTARFFSGLSTYSFMRATSIARMSAEGLRTCAPHVRTLAQAEGLPAHAASVAVRFER